MPSLGSTSTNCSLKQLNESCIQLNIHFDHVNNAKTAKSFIFELDPSVKRVQGCVSDVFTKNGVCHSKLLVKLFGKNEVQDAGMAAQLLAKMPKQNTDPVVAVFDLQGSDRTKRYLAAEEITKCEDTVQQFFSAELPTKAKRHIAGIHNTFHQSLHVSHILCEGSLKTDLLVKGGFEDHEISHLNSPSGAQDFCGFTEYFMTFFKMGYAVKTESQEYLLGEKYFKPLKPKNTYVPQVNSVVYYPKDYEEMYSLSGTYATLMKDAFTITHQFDSPTRITTLNLVKS